MSFRLSTSNRKCHVERARRPQLQAPGVQASPRRTGARVAWGIGPSSLRRSSTRRGLERGSPPAPRYGARATCLKHVSRVDRDGTLSRRGAPARGSPGAAGVPFPLGMFGQIGEPAQVNHRQGEARAQVIHLRSSSPPPPPPGRGPRQWGRKAFGQMGKLPSGSIGAEGGPPPATERSRRPSPAVAGVRAWARDPDMRPRHVGTPKLAPPPPPPAARAPPEGRRRGGGAAPEGGEKKEVSEVTAPRGPPRGGHHALRTSSAPHGVSLGVSGDQARAGVSQMLRQALPTWHRAPGPVL